MQRDIAEFFWDSILPVIGERHPNAAREMAVQVCGSYGLGVADEYSDLDATIWLDDPLWKEEGGNLQLTLANHVPRFVPEDGPHKNDHAEFVVWPLSWLGDRKRLLDETSDSAWEKVDIEELFEIQTNLVLRDPHGLFQRLKEATTPENYPRALWKKRLIEEMKDLDDDIADYLQAVRRNREVEAAIINGRIVERVLQLGFLVARHYYPWHKHLHWAFLTLPAPASKVCRRLESLTGSGSLNDKLAAVQETREAYASAILEQGLLTEEILSDLEWAGRLKAWSNANWRKWIESRQIKAEAAGYTANDSWIWSLWGW